MTRTKWVVYGIKADDSGRLYTGSWNNQFDSDRRNPKTWSRAYDARRIAKRINKLALLDAKTPNSLSARSTVQVVPLEVKG